MQTKIKTDDYELWLGDCIKLMRDIPPASFDLSVFSPPFASLFVYSGKPEDMGNSHSSAKEDEFMLHYRFFAQAFAPLLKPGRNAIVHVAQPSRFKTLHGHMGVWDLRGRVIDEMENAGLIYYGDITVEKNPQAQAIRTKSHALMFVQLERDASMMRPALADYCLIFKQLGDNQVPVTPDCTREEWIEWASSIWRGIKESDVLNTDEAKTKDDQRHPCPLQLDLISRCVRLWSNKGETVFTPFAGIGSELYESIRVGRKAFGIELKEEYFSVARKNSDRAARERDSQMALSLKA